MEESTSTSWLKTRREDTNKSSEENKKGTAKLAKFDEIICSDDDDRPNYQKMELIEAFVKSIIEGAIQHYLSEFPKGYRDTSEDGENRDKESEIELNLKFLADEDNAANTSNLSGLEQRKNQRKKGSPYEVTSSPDGAQKETNPLLSKTKPSEGSKLSIEEDVSNGSFRSCLLNVLCCCMDRQ